VDRTKTTIAKPLRYRSIQSLLEYARWRLCEYCTKGLTARHLIYR
jgi:hypothetical protein